jgi:uncharacterized cupredoxin-like copper-binding protein
MMGQQSASGQHPGGFGGPMMGSPPSGYHSHDLSCTAPTSLPGTTVYLMLGDMGMTSTMNGDAPRGGHMMLRAVPAAVPAGQVSFEVANMGWRTHEMVVLPLPGGQSAGERTPGSDGRVDETASLGEASASCAAGTGDGITSGSIGWVSLRLSPGRYELVCNLKNHYANGMHEAFTVS